MEESAGGRSVVLSAGTNSIIWERLLGLTSPSAVSLSVRHGIPITIYLKGSSHLIKRFHVCWEEPGTHTHTHTNKKQTYIYIYIYIYMLYTLSR